MSVQALTVADCMVPARLTVTPDTTIPQAVEKMLNAKLIGAPVVDENQRVVGYISEQDCLRYMISDSYYDDQRELVRDVMKHEVLFAEPSMSIVDMAQLMCGNKPKKYPVCENGRLIGVINRTHVITALLKATSHK
ncbi:CBS domain-containing protein [Reinekea blandensis]|uniref:CBS domain protein n=1 Tax=Reinekea blandensis MED297 TaxID=314283 RepID=A4BC23_9GAMM|nr:CBS domain-containing protein [Reinekea blandensis]EAR10508.1 CBS domain protein [Reinekea sp. MED297] [Reinekea blandensis MED297]